MGFEKYSREELMVCVCSRMIKDFDRVFVGIGIPLLASAVAIRSHAPNALLMFEGGGIGPISRRIMFSVGDNSTTDNAIAATELWRILGDLQRGFVDIGVVGGAQIDRFGNLNSTAIFDGDANYSRPTVRLGGSGGANDIASSVKRFITVIRLEKKRFVKKVDYISSPGFLDGGDARKKAGLSGGGPETVVTNKCIFRFDPVTKEMYLDELFPGVTKQEIIESVSWDLKVSPNLKETLPPKEEEIRIIREVDPTNVFLGSKSEIEGESFEKYFSDLKAAYEATFTLVR